ncbi:MAG: hypothetical protein Q8Q81_19905 [Oxalobacteraceae bacterium]|nr:hypothetical protein [Oxalobacteraceae bacterium]
MKTGKVEYLMAFWLIMVSGNPIFTPNRWREAIVFSITFLICVLYRSFFKRIISDVGFMIFSALFFLIFIIHAFEFNFFPLQSIASFYIRLLLGFILFRAIPSGTEKYIKCLYWICVISLIFYIPSEILRILFGVSLRSFFEPLKFISGDINLLHVIVYNFDGAGEPNRNSGPFWEPGAFSGYILVAILLLSQYKNNIHPKYYWKYLIIFIISMLSTKSTTGYLLLPIALIPHMNFELTKNSKMLGFRMLMVASVILVGIIFSPRLLQLDFIGEKISNQYEEAVNKQQGWEINRFGNFIFDLQYIKERPLFGWGINEKTRYALHGGKAVIGQGNGFTDGIIKFGFIGFGLYVISLFFSFRRFYSGNLKNIFISLLVIMLALNAEIFLNFPIFLGLIALRRS